MAVLRRIHGTPQVPSLPSTALLAAVLLSVTPPVHAGDWPQWRGPNRDGVWSETGILPSFPPGGLKIQWRMPVGIGWSSPVVAEGRVFVTDSVVARPTAVERIHGFDASTGKPLWTITYEVVYPDWAFVAGQEVGVSATPLAEGGKVYALGGNGDVHCLDAGKGTVLWRRDLGNDYQIEKVMCRASPLIEGNLLIVFTGAKPGACVMALDKDTGKEVWKALDEGVSNSSPLVIEAGGKKQLIVWTQQSVTSLDPATGATWWRERLISSNDYAVSSPVVRKNLLLVGGMMFRLRAEEPAATVLWPKTRVVTRRVLSNTSTAAIAGGYVYSAKSSGEFVCLDATTGEQVWQTEKVTDLLNGASIHITLNGDSALLYNDRGELIRARLTAGGYQELGRAALLEPTYAFGGRKCAWTPPAFANQRVFARSDKEIVCASLAVEP